jgi:hypothetical protein
MSPRLALVIALGTGLILGARTAGAQDLEPRQYSNSPVGMNFLIAGYSYSSGGLSFDPALPIVDAKVAVHSILFDYVRVIDLWGKSAKLDAGIPYLALNGSATFEGQPVERQIQGFGDARLRLSVNLYGAPALAPKDFGAYKRDLVIGASVQVSVPTGQYDPSKLLNAGANRWWIKPSIGFSKAFGSISLDVTGEATFYSENHSFFGGRRLELAPVYSAQASVTFDFGDGLWASIGETYYTGGRATIDGVESATDLGNLRAGAIVALPITRSHSLKLTVSRGLYTRSGSDFLSAGIAWQWRWGAGW